MSRYICLMCLAILLSGCKSEPTFEMCENYYSRGYEEGKEEGYNEGYGIVEEICGGDATCDDYY